MAELFSRYASGVQWTAGAMAGSIDGTSGINPIMDRLNSISTDNNLVTGSFISGTSTQYYGETLNDSLIGSGHFLMTSGNTLAESVVITFSADQLGSLDGISLIIDVANTNSGKIGNYQVEHKTLTGTLSSNANTINAGSSAHTNIIISSNAFDFSAPSESVSLFESSQINSNQLNYFDLDTTMSLRSPGSLIIQSNSNSTNDVGVKYKIIRNRL